MSTDARCLIGFAAWLLLVTPSLSQEPVPARPLEIGETFTIDSRVLGEVRRINVCLPQAYTDSKDPLPVLYMPDGGLAEDFLHIAGLAQVCSGNGSMRPHILVGIENTERRRDLTGPTQVDEEKKAAPKAGGSGNFRRFLREELKPAIAKRYRTTKESAIIGESLAGLFVIETMLLEPELFESYIAIDPSVWWNRQSLVASAAATLKAKAPLQKQLFLASSEEKENEVILQKLVEILKADPSVRTTFKQMPEEKHATIFHPAALQAMRELLAPRKK